MDILQETIVLIVVMKMVMATEMVTEILTEMGTVGMVVEMVTVALVVMVVVMAQAGGGVGESVVYETSNPRIPRKKGQPAGSKKHSDLYTDENPKGTIHGLGFKDVATAKASVSKIRSSSRSHAHKIQAAVAMEQRAREMGKTSEAAVYRKYINSMKKKTKKMNEGMDNHPEFALITVAVDELEKG